MEDFKNDNKDTNQQGHKDNSYKLEKKKMSALKRIGIILLIIIGVPLLLFGACVLMLSTNFIGL